jgi:hypothetical protein
MIKVGIVSLLLASGLKRPFDADRSEHDCGLKCSGDRSSHRGPSAPFALPLKADVNIIKDQKQIFLRT